MPHWYSDPHWLLALVMVTVGFYALLKGADLLVRGAVVLARHSGLSTAVIGATVVAFGTSLPELVVSLTSMFQAQRLESPATADIALSNVVGSNIFNIALILGLSALWRPLPVPPSCVRLDYPLMLVASLVLILFSIPWGGGPALITWWQGAILLAGLVAFMVMAVRLDKIDPSEVDEVTPRASAASPPSALSWWACWPWPWAAKWLSPER